MPASCSYLILYFADVGQVIPELLVLLVLVVVVVVVVVVV
jgi:hypothetical protein